MAAVSTNVQSNNAFVQCNIKLSDCQLYYKIKKDTVSDESFVCAWSSIIFNDQNGLYIFFYDFSSHEKYLCI